MQEKNGKLPRNPLIKIEQYSCDELMFLFL